MPERDLRHDKGSLAEIERFTPSAATPRSVRGQAGS